MSNPQVVLDFWFDHESLWYAKNLEFDEEIKQKFSGLYAQARTEQLNQWASTAEGSLALIILLDQFSRNMFRDQPEAFNTDQMALALTHQAIDNGLDEQLSPMQRHFLYMPFMHSEDINEQELGLKYFAKIGKDGKPNEFAIAHRDIIARFGRFPHRNIILGRESTAEELEFLKQPGSSF